MRTNYKRVSNILNNNFECEIIQSPVNGIVAIFSPGTEDEQRVRVILQDFCYHTLQTSVGIHHKMVNKNDLEYNLTDAMETALKDNFPAIYIHQQPKEPRRSKESLLKAIKGWTDAFEKKGITYQMRKMFLPLEDVLATMDENQLHAVLMLISCAYRKAGDDSREWHRRYAETKVETQGAS